MLILQMIKNNILNFLGATFSVVLFGVTVPVVAIWLHQHNHPEELYFSSTLGATALAINSVPVGVALGLYFYLLIGRNLRQYLLKSHKTKQFH